MKTRRALGFEAKLGLGGWMILGGISLSSCSDELSGNCIYDIDCQGTDFCVAGRCTSQTCPGNPCPAGNECQSGTCVLTVPTNCGGKTCQAGNVCVNQTCCTKTEARETSCNDSIDNDCDGSTDAQDRDCLTPDGCVVPNTKCDGRCVDTSANSLHCGTCGNACASDQSCVDSVCKKKLVCVYPSIECANTCVDSTTNDNCGSCGVVCTAPQACQGGVCSDSCGSKSFSLTSTQDSFQIPENVKFLHVKAWGAGANAEAPCHSGEDNGGLGGYSEAVFEIKDGTALTPTSNLIVIVGGPGHASGSSNDYRFGFGNSGGGGLSGVFISDTTIVKTDCAKALIIAGGGGGAWPGCNSSGNSIVGGVGNAGNAGGEINMQGSTGSDDGVNGGGGGCRGGTGGSSDHAGKGGTGFISTLAVPNSVKNLAPQPGSGKPPNADDPDYISAGGTAGKTEKPGLLLMYFTCESPL